MCPGASAFENDGESTIKVAVFASITMGVTDNPRMARPVVPRPVYMAVHPKLGPCGLDQGRQIRCIGSVDRNLAKTRVEARWQWDVVRDDACRAVKWNSQSLLDARARLPM